MSDLDLIGRILSHTKISLSISINEHRSVYEPADHYLDNDPETTIDPDVRRTMIETDTIIEIWCYPNTPVGHHKVYHHDLTAALTEMLRILESQ